MALDRNKQVLELIDKSSRILICFSQQHTVDSVASALLLAEYLKYKEKEYTIVCDGFEHSDKHGLFTPEIKSVQTRLESPQEFVVQLDIGAHKVKEFRYAVEGTSLNIFITPEKGYIKESQLQAVENYYQYDLIVTIDSSDLKSLGAVFQDHTQFFYDTPILNIDHTVANEQYGQVNMVDITAVSVSEILYNFIKKNDNAFLKKSHYTTALSGIIYKTQSFRTPTVTPRSLHIASELIERGADKEHIIKHLYQKKSLSLMKLWGMLLSRLDKKEGTHILYSYLTQDDLVGVTLDSQAILDIIDELLVHIPGSDIILLTYEREKNVLHHVVWTSAHYESIQLVKKYSPRAIKNLAYFKTDGIGISDAQKNIIEVIEEKVKK